MAWIEINSKEDLPPPYTDVLVYFEAQLRVMRHENGWWYGLAPEEQPDTWYKNDVLSIMLKEAKQGIANRG